MLGSFVIFGLILLLCLAVPVYKYNLEWGYKPAAVLGALLVAALVCKYTGVL